MPKGTEVERKVTAEDVEKALVEVAKREPPMEEEPKEQLPQEVEKPPTAALKPCPMICRYIKCKWYDHCWKGE